MHHGAVAKVGAAVRIYRPRQPLQLSQGYFTVFIDGVERGELWGHQVRVFDVSPGMHDVQVGAGWGWFWRSRPLRFDVEVGQIADFACSPVQSFLGWGDLRPATEWDKARMQRLIASPPAPRNLATPEADGGS